MHSSAKNISQKAEIFKPEWHCEEYYDQMKRRLFEKDEEHYKQWAYLGKSNQNFYYVDGEWRVYENGKRIK